MQAGSTLGSYEVLSAIDGGGMGKVWRARDTRLDREVAIKTLPDAVARDRHRLARFEREARLLASLNHPHIAAIYGLETHEDSVFLVLELVEGETLAHRVARGAIPVGESVAIALQIAEAVEAAHQKGVTHRDLKPANIMVTPQGTVKVLDFGLAKSLDSDHAADDPRATTETAGLTVPGAVMGTVPYMSPEQARGQPTDTRTDIWSFGVVLYEMLTGRRPFAGDDTASLVAHILERDPDFDALPTTLSPAVWRLLRRCLTKDSRERLRDIGDARIELRAASTPEPAEAEGTTAGRPRLTRWAYLGLGIAVGLAVAGLERYAESDRAGPQPPVSRLEVTLPRGLATGAFASSPVGISPDGRTLVYVVRNGDGSERLYRRSLDAFEPAAIEGTNGAGAPFFSPDGQWVGFVADGQLKKVRLTGSDPMTIAPVGGLLLGASWGPDDSIVFANSRSTGLWRVSSGGGTPRALTRPDTSVAAGHRFPYQLPDGSGILFSLNGSTDLGFLPSGSDRWQTVARGDRRFTGMHYVPPGYLVYGQGGAIMAAPFDLAHHRLTRAAAPLVQGVGASSVSQYVWFAVSDTGTLAYLEAGGPTNSSSLVSVGANGTVTTVAPLQGAGGGVRLSPSRNRAGLVLRLEGVADAWVCDLERGVVMKATSGLEAYAAVWAPNGRDLTVGTLDSLYSVDASGAGSPKRLVSRADRPLLPLSWSPDGRHLLLLRQAPSTGADILVYSSGDGTVAPLLATGADESDAGFSPGGDWIAYVSDETGRSEVYVRPFPASGGRTRVSRDGGMSPRWFQDGNRLLLYYWTGGRILRVPVSLNPLRFGPAEPVGAESGFTDIAVNYGYDVAADGSVLAVKTPMGTPEAARLRLVQHWGTELAERVPSS